MKKETSLSLICSLLPNCIATLIIYILGNYTLLEAFYFSSFTYTAILVLLIIILTAIGTIRKLLLLSNYEQSYLDNESKNLSKLLILTDIKQKATKSFFVDFMLVKPFICSWLFEKFTPIDRYSAFAILYLFLTIANIIIASPGRKQTR